MSPRPKHRLRAALATAIVSVVAIALWRGVIFAPHLIESGDLLQPFSMDSFRTLFWPFWNAAFEFPNVETAGRLAWMIPFLGFQDAQLAQSWMIAAVVLAAAWSMLFATRRLGAPWLLACTAAILYASTPWAAIRLHHYFLLPGYAVLPALLSLWLRPLRNGTAWIQALLFTVAATTPHYLAFAWALTAVWLLLYPRRRNLRLVAATTLRFLALNVLWLVPTAAYTLLAALVPSLPNWDMATNFSRGATLPSVARLDGYWWPLADVTLPGWLEPFGWALLAAALLGAVSGRKGRRLWVVAAIAFGAIALGTKVPWLMRALALEGPLAHRLGWLFRDPNKAVGPLAAVLFLLAAASPRQGAQRWRFPLQLGLLLAYGAFALPWTSAYLRGAYEPHPPPAAYENVNEWLRERPGRVLWTPRFNGAKALWNGNNLTPEVAEYSSRPPVLDSYGYDSRARRANQALEVDVLGGRVRTDVGATLRLWGARWLVHHRDLAPPRDRTPNSYDARLERLPRTIEASGLERVLYDSPLHVYDAGEPVPPFVAATPLLTNHALAATLTLQNFATAVTGVAFTEAERDGAAGVALLPGDDARVLLSEGAYAVDLAATTVRYDPDHYWSRVAESDPQWDAMAVAAGLPGGTDATVVFTRAVGSTLTAHFSAPGGPYRALLRAYQGPQAGAMTIAIGDGAPQLVDTTGRLTRSTWYDLGPVVLSGSTSASVTNLDGLNALTALWLVPAANWARADEAAKASESAWLWPSSALCEPAPTAHGVEDLALASTVHALPWQTPVAGAASWSSYDAVQLELHGDGAGRYVEVWTNAADVWVLLGRVRLWWQGWRDVRLPVVTANFASAPGGAGNRVELVRVLPPQNSGSAIELRDVSLVVDRSCSLTLESASDTPAVLRVAQGDATLSVQLNGETLTVVGSEATPVQLRPGRNRIDLPRSAMGSVDALLVHTIGIDPGAPGVLLPYVGAPSATPLDRRSDLVCSDAWRLVVTDALYVPGLGAAVGAVHLDTVPVDHLRLGAWVPPGVCGVLQVNNPWRWLGTAGAWASLVMVAALGLLDATSLRRRAALSTRAGEAA